MTIQSYQHQTEIPERFRKLATLCSMASLFSYAVMLSITPASLNEIRREFGVGYELLGRLNFALMFFYIISVVAGGRLSDRYGKPLFMFIGCALLAAGAVVFGLSGSFGVCIGSSMLVGIGGGFAQGASVAFISEIYARKRRTTMLNWSQIAFSAGAVAAPQVISRIIGLEMSWRLGYFAGGAVAALGAVIALICLIGARKVKVTGGHGSENWGSLISNPLVLLFSVGIFLYVGAEIGQMYWIANYWAEELGADRAMSAWSVGLFWLGVGAGRAVAGMLSGKISDNALIRVALAGAAASQTWLLLLKNPDGAWIAALVLGFFLGPIFPTILSRAGHAFPAQTGAVFGIVAAAGSVGGAIFPPAIGWLAERFTLRDALWICLALHIINFLVSFTPNAAYRRA